MFSNDQKTSSFLPVCIVAGIVFSSTAFSLKASAELRCEKAISVSHQGKGIISTSLRDQLLDKTQKHENEVLNLIDKGVKKIKWSLLSPEEIKILDEVSSLADQLRSSRSYKVSILDGYRVATGVQVDQAVALLKQIRLFANSKLSHTYILGMIEGVSVGEQVYKDQRHIHAFVIAHAFDQKTGDFKPVNWVGQMAESLYWYRVKQQGIIQELNDYGLASGEQIPKKYQELIVEAVKSLNWQSETFQFLKDAHTKAVNIYREGSLNRDQALAKVTDTVLEFINSRPEQFKSGLQRIDVNSALIRGMNFGVSDAELLAYFSNYLSLTGSTKQIQDLGAFNTLKVMVEIHLKNPNARSQQALANELEQMNLVLP